MSRWHARFDPATVAALAILATVLGTGGCGTRANMNASTSESKTDSNPSLVLYCAAGIKPPVEAAAKQYEEEFGIPVELQYGGSGTLLASIETARQGDLYLAADDSYIKTAKEKGLVAEEFPLATQQAVLAVHEGNAAGVKSIDSLLEGELRIGIANPDAAAVGRTSQSIFERAGTWDQIKAAVEARGVFKPTVTDLANDLRIGSIDVAVLWDATVAQYPDLVAIAFDPSLQEPQDITLGVLTSASDPTSALRFARYLGSRDKGLTDFTKEGYQVVDGDLWGDGRTELTIYSGGVLRPAVDDTIREFAEHEGVTINTVYNGCGILVGQMKTGQLPDAYLSCDTSFMVQVADQFGPSRDISRTRMVISVPKDNPRDIQGLADLGQPNLRVGVCNAEQSALGALTRNLLQAEGLYDEVMKNVVTQVPTADLLITQLRTGGLDAAIVYEVNHMRVAEHLKMIEIPESSAIAVQPMAVCKASNHKFLTGRLLETLRASTSHERFISSGFTWLDVPSSPVTGTK